MITAKRTVVSILVVTALVLFPVPFYGQGQSGGVAGKAPLPTPITNQMSATSPPVAPPLVPEGVFAVQLVEALQIGQAQDEAQAETMLSEIGIEPKNGWIAGYPVTPDIVGEIETSVAASVDAKTLKMGKDQAQKAVENVTAQLGLNVMSASPAGFAQAAPTGNVPIYRYVDDSGVLYYTDRYELIPKEYRGQLQAVGEGAPPQPSDEPVGEMAEVPVNNYAASPAPEVINNYYYNDGPPVVTYYAPPMAYYPLYAWVPYPFRSSGFFFPGFFILRDFHKRVSFNRHPFVITNHVVVNRSVSVVNPITRAYGGRMGDHRVPSPGVVGPPSARGGAQGFSALSHGTANPGKVTTRPGFNNGVPSSSSNRTPAQNRPGQGPNVTTLAPSTINRGTTSNPTGMGRADLRPSTDPRWSGTNWPASSGQPVRPNDGSLGSQPRNPVIVSRPPVTVRTTPPPTVSTSPRAEPRDFIAPPNAGNQNRTSYARPAAPQPRAFNPPVPSGGSFSQAPRAPVSSPPSTAQHMGSFGTPSSGSGGSGTGSQGSSGFTGHGGFSGGSFGGHR
jgi:hypothetical protein